ncbi:glycoside hydrolase family 10 protein [Kamptonema formosum]|uniref:glycoside hydrolase family 10 protein n=1 Tax=Kamptonema formosum TaxID=331992 RepID=UPI00037710EC|nr:glycoside hydrolase family 10 protein [Oscillatoria sp. PCC 10802]
MFYPRKWQLGFAFLAALTVTIVLLLSPAFAERKFPSGAPVLSQVPAIQSKEIRGVWLTNIDSDALFSSRGVARSIQRLSQMNFNTVYPTIWNWGYTLYPSKVAERVTGRAVRLVTPADSSLDPDLGVRGRDMLKEVIEQGHKRGMAVIPWFEFGFMAPADSELALRHPDWLTSRRDGSKIWKEGSDERVWLNPFHPEVQQFVLDLIMEVVSKYDVDGIQFDDHFALPVEFGYDKLTVGMYQEEIKQPPSDNFQETFWVRWRADKLNEFMERVFRAVKAQKPNCIISVSPNPLHFSLPAHLQDWFTWERRGFAEEIVLQVYRNDLKRFSKELERAEVDLAKSHIPVGIGILTGLKGRSIPLSQIEEQVKAVRERGLAGVSFFFYESLSSWATETPADREAAFKGMFSVPVGRPNVLQGWKPANS